MKAPARVAVVEAAVVGAVLRDATLLDELDFGARDFSHPGYRRVWLACSALWAKGEPVTPPAVLTAMAPKSDIETERCRKVISEALDGGALPEGIRGYAASLEREAMTRHVLEATARVQEAASKRGMVGGDLLRYALDAVQSAAREPQARAVDLGEGVKTFIRDAQARQRKREAGENTEATGVAVPTGLGDLKLPRGLVSVLGGAGGEGKSSVAQAIAEHVQCAGGGVLVASYEDPHAFYQARSLARESGVPFEALSNDEIMPEDYAVLIPAAEAIAARPGRVRTVMAGGKGADYLARMARVLSRAGGLDLVVVDYVQRMPVKPGEDLKYAIRRQLGELEDLAQELGVAVLALSQIKHAADPANPTRKDFAESPSAFEQIGKTIVIVRRPGRDTPDDHTLDLHVVKVNNGPAGYVIECGWYGPTVRITPPTQREMLHGR